MYSVAEGHDAIGVIDIYASLGCIGAIADALDRAVSEIAAVPTLSIIGPNVLRIYRWQSLSLFASTSLPTCAGSLGNYLDYIWKVYDGIQYIDAITSSQLKTTSIVTGTGS
jgi:hypothetical protein